MSDPVPARLLVTGSGGHLGRRVVELLLEAGASNITASSRSPKKLSRFAAKAGGNRADIILANYSVSG